MLKAYCRLNNHLVWMAPPRIDVYNGRLPAPAKVEKRVQFMYWAARCCGRGDPGTSAECSAKNAELEQCDGHREYVALTAARLSQCFCSGSHRRPRRQSAR